MRLVYRVLLNFSLIFTFCNANCYYSVIPLTASFNPKQIINGTNRQDDSITYTLTNGSSDPIALEVKVYERSMDADGADKLSTTEAFHISQPQIIIAPKETARIILKYKQSEYNNSKEQAYRVCFKQAPIKGLAKEKVNIGEAKHSITVTVSVTASLYMTPAGTKPDVCLVSASGNVVTLKNKGTRHIEAKDINIPVTIGGKVYAFNAVVAKNDREKVILPDHTRKLCIDPARQKDAPPFAEKRTQTRMTEIPQKV